MNLRNHLVDVAAEFLYVGLVDGRHEDARGLFLCDPGVFQFFQSQVFLSLRGKGEFIIFLILVGVYLVEYHIDRLVGSPGQVQKIGDPNPPFTTAGDVTTLQFL